MDVLIVYLVQDAPLHPADINTLRRLFIIVSHTRKEGLKSTPYYLTLDRPDSTRTQPNDLACRRSLHRTRRTDW